MTDFIKGGRGKKAPYDTVMYRIPVPIKPAVELFAHAYRFLIDGGADPTGKHLIKRVTDSLKCDHDHKQPTHEQDDEDLDSIKDDSEVKLQERELTELKSLLEKLKASEQKAKDLERDLEETYLELSKVRSQLVEAAKDCEQLAALKVEKEQMEHLKNQPTVAIESVASQEIIKLLEQAITPQKKGGSYLANNASGLKLVVEQALKQLAAATVISIDDI